MWWTKGCLGRKNTVTYKSERDSINWLVLLLLFWFTFTRLVRSFHFFLNDKFLFNHHKNIIGWTLVTKWKCLWDNIQIKNRKRWCTDVCGSFLRFLVNLVLALKFAKGLTSGQGPFAGGQQWKVSSSPMRTTQPEEVANIKSVLRRGSCNRRRAKLRARSSGCPPKKQSPPSFLTK